MFTELNCIGNRLHNTEKKTELFSSNLCYSNFQVLQRTQKMRAFLCHIVANEGAHGQCDQWNPKSHLTASQDCEH